MAAQFTPYVTLMGGEHRITVYFLIKLKKGRKRIGNTNQREMEGIHFSFFYNDYIIRRKVCKFTGMYEYHKRAK